MTTHSRTKRLRHTLLMLASTLLIERELRGIDGCERYANVLAGPRELWTVTIWRDETELRTSMRKGVHGRVMWQQPYWLDCYWGMRWRPGRHWSGKWEGKPWQGRAAQADGAGAGGDVHDPSVMPSWMQSALRMTVPLERRQVTGTAGATYRLRVPPRSFPRALRDLLRLESLASSDPDSFRASCGVGTDGALYLLVVTTSPQAVERLRTSREHSRLAQRWGTRLWCSTWEPESEFGHWRGRRMREGRLAREAVLAEKRLAIEPVAPRHARETLRQCLGTLDPSVLDTLQLLASELVANALNHAGLSSAGWIRLEVRSAVGWVRVDVVDSGRRFEPHVPLVAPSHGESGRGLFIVDRASDRWGITDSPGERRIWFELQVPGAGRATVPVHASSAGRVNGDGERPLHR